MNLYPFDLNLKIYNKSRKEFSLLKLNLVNGNKNRVTKISVCMNLQNSTLIYNKIVWMKYDHLARLHSTLFSKRYDELAPWTVTYAVWNLKPCVFSLYVYMRRNWIYILNREYYRYAYCSVVSEKGEKTRTYDVRNLYS